MCLIKGLSQEPLAVSWKCALVSAQNLGIVFYYHRIFSELIMELIEFLIELKLS
jgi:hypothetical protein